MASSNSIGTTPPSISRPGSHGGATRVRPEDLIVTNGLGKGSHSVVVEVLAAAFSLPTHDHFQTHFAMKCIPKANISRPSHFQRLRNEIDILTTVKPSRFLLRSHLAFESASHIFLLTDYLSGGDLLFRLDQKIDLGLKGFPEHSVRTILAEVTLGIIHLHDLGYIHHDINIDNVVFDAQGHAKLIDFGLAELITGEPKKKIQGTLSYMAPELLSQCVNGFFTDWWAMGILAYELMTGRAPWSTLEDRRQICKEIMTLEIGAPVGMSQSAGNFIHSLLRKDHQLRLGTKCDHEVLSSPFFEGVDWEAMMRGETPPALTPRAGEVSVDPREVKESLETYCQVLSEQPAQDSESTLKEMRNLGLQQTTCGPPCISIHAGITQPAQSRTIPLATGGPSRFVRMGDWRGAAV